MPPHATIVISDAHLQAARDERAQALHRFLGGVPTMADHLVIGGDLFEFWMEYRSVIPREAFPTLVALAQVRAAGVALTVIGGNHDRWGGTFWRDQLDASFYPGTAEVELTGFTAHVAHGDGIAEAALGARLVHALLRRPVAARLFRTLPPDLGFGLVRRLAPVLAGRTGDEPRVRQAAAAQAAYARQLLARRRDLELVVLAHTHRAALEQVGERRWYLNPGPWMDGFHYARITPEEPVLERFEE